VGGTFKSNDDDANGKENKSVCPLGNNKRNLQLVSTRSHRLSLTDLQTPGSPKNTAKPSKPLKTPDTEGRPKQGNGDDNSVGKTLIFQHQRYKQQATNASPNPKVACSGCQELWRHQKSQE